MGAMEVVMVVLSQDELIARAMPTFASIAKAQEPRRLHT